MLQKGKKIDLQLPSMAHERLYKLPETWCTILLGTPRNLPFMILTLHMEKEYSIFLS